MQRITRMLDVLRGADRTTVPALAAALGVSERTVRRDLARATELGAVLDVRPGRLGGVRLVRDESLPALRFTEQEALALALTLASASADPRLAGPARSARTRLSRVLTHEHGAQLAALADALSAGDLGDPADRTTLLGDDDVRAAELFALCAAVARRHRVEFRYRSARPGPGTARRPVDPWGVVRMAGHWYLVGRCGLRRTTRTFRIDRIRDVVEHDTAVLVPDDVDPAAVVAAGIQASGRVPHRCEFLLGLPLEQAEQLAPRYRLALQEVPEHPGRVLGRINAESRHLPEIARMLVSWDCEVQVLGPPALRGALAQLADRATALAGSGPG